MKFNKFIISCLLLALPIQGIALVMGVQEKGDVQFRTLAMPLVTPIPLNDDHSGVYWEYTTGDPQNPMHHLLVEMLGSPENGIVSNTLETFKGITSYYGAYTLSVDLPRYKRLEIVETAKRLRDKNNPSIQNKRGRCFVSLIL